MFIAVIVADSWHIANGQHFGDLIHLPSTGIAFNDRIDAINNAFTEVSEIYKGIEPVHGKLEDAYFNELDYNGRQFNLYCFRVLTHRL